MHYSPVLGLLYNRYSGVLFTSLLTAQSDYFGKVIDPGQIVGFKDAIVGEADPWLVVNLAELLSHRRHNSPRHTAMRHDRYYTSEVRVFQPLHSSANAEYRLTATPRREVQTCL